LAAWCALSGNPFLEYVSMAKLSFFLACVVLASAVLAGDSEQLRTYVRLIGQDSSKPMAERIVIEPLVDGSCEVFPKILTVGDVLYIKATIRNNSQEPLEYTFRPGALGHERFLIGFAELSKDSSAGFGPEKSDVIPLRTVSVPVGLRPLPPTRILSSGSTLISGPDCVFLPPPGNYDRQSWLRDDLAEGEKILFTVQTSLVIPNAARRMTIAQELIVKPRPKDELQFIKEWRAKGWTFENLWYSAPPGLTTAAQWREFEEGLTPGTLRNYIRVNRTLVEIAQDENKGKRQELFNEMFKWFDELHPLEKEGLTKRAYEIVMAHPSRFDNEIAVPVAAE